MLSKSFNIISICLHIVTFCSKIIDKNHQLIMHNFWNPRNGLKQIKFTHNLFQKHKIIYLKENDLLHMLDRKIYLDSNPFFLWLFVLSNSFLFLPENVPPPLFWGEERGGTCAITPDVVIVIPFLFLKKILKLKQGKVISNHGGTTFAFNVPCKISTCCHWEEVFFFFSFPI